MKIYFSKTILSVAFALVPATFSYAINECPKNYHATLSCSKPTFKFSYPEDITGINSSTCTNGVLTLIRDQWGQIYPNSDGTWTIDYDEIDANNATCTLTSG